MGGLNLFGGTIAALVLGVALISVDPALAGPPSVPAPIVGAGLPGLAILGGVYGAIWLRRKLRKP
jgi:hypothetical protein